MEIITDRFLIRNLKSEDAEDLAEVLSDAEVMKYLEPPFSMEQTREFINTAGLSEPPLVYAVEEMASGRVIGHVIYHSYDKDSYEIGWVIGRNFWNMGIAGELTEALIMQAMKAGIKCLVIECVGQQTASRRIAERYRFLYQGKRDGLDVYRRFFNERIKENEKIHRHSERDRGTAASCLQTGGLHCNHKMD